MCLILPEEFAFVSSEVSMFAIKSKLWVSSLQNWARSDLGGLHVWPEIDRQLLPEVVGRSRFAPEAMHLPD